MVRKLKYHEQKLLKKVDFLNWKQDANLREIKVMRRYHIQDREDYHKYNKLCGSLRSFAHRITLLPAQDPFRARMESQLLNKLYDMGVLNSSAKLSDVDKLTVAAFCRRRLAVVMCMSKMAETVSAAAKFIEQGHVRVGPDTITDPAYLVTRRMEDFVTWVDTSKLKRIVMSYNDELDDFDLL
ncbi:u3 small nucleolar ribonucleoprotein imp3 [Moniliophthora roreri MCA 2997]|uniref:U3 small nucleolar ribonucleoprotein protein IMP3 n=2 Tax=Moniliophthora roreri TaxID=221103 RepID=V2XKZ8_MONRO|nr:u3 small nucleolar ribonucleoprotein imp3 [Moniliophthora roreri MCA 2997]KAI3604405.1 u3 small nucleolar ribonucleoprotein imp3 [Moniliophthora roreri]